MTLGEQFDEVLAAAQLGEEWAITGLYRELAPAVLSFLRARVGDEADDIASQTWLEVARGIDRFSGDEPGFRGWVFTIARRRLANERRRLGRRRTEWLGGTDVAGTDDVAARSESDEAVRRIVGLLPPDLAEVVLLRVVAGLPVEEVARVTGRRPGNVRVMQHRAMKRLAAALGSSDALTDEGAGL